MDRRSPFLKTEIVPTEVQRIVVDKHDTLPRTGISQNSGYQNLGPEWSPGTDLTAPELPVRIDLQITQSVKVIEANDGLPSTIPCEGYVDQKAVLLAPADADSAGFQSTLRP